MVIHWVYISQASQSNVSLFVASALSLFLMAPPWTMMPARPERTMNQTRCNVWVGQYVRRNEADELMQFIDWWVYQELSWKAAICSGDKTSLLFCWTVSSCLRKKGGQCGDRFGTANGPFWVNIQLLLLLLLPKYCCSAYCEQWTGWGREFGMSRRSTKKKLACGRCQKPNKKKRTWKTFWHF